MREFWKRLESLMMIWNNGTTGRDIVNGIGQAGKSSVGERPLEEKFRPPERRNADWKVGR